MAELLRQKSLFGCFVEVSLSEAGVVAVAAVVWVENGEIVRIVRMVAVVVVGVGVMMRVGVRL